MTAGLPTGKDAELVENRNRTLVETLRTRALVETLRTRA